MRISACSSVVSSSDLMRLLATIKNSDVREAYATALRELYRGGGSRSNAAGGGMRAAAGNVALAVEAALVLGLVDHPGVIDGHGIDVPRLRWRSDERRVGKGGVVSGCSGWSP